MEKEIDILFLSDIGYFLDNENIHYIVENDNNQYYISYVPIIFRDYISNIYTKLAYDYNTLNDNNKNIFNNKFKKFIKNNDNTYSLVTKEYKIKRKIR